MQEKAYNSKAEVIGLGGEAGGGKSDVLFGKAWRDHPDAIVFRQELKQMENRIIPRGIEVFTGVGEYKGGMKNRFEHARGFMQLGALKIQNDFAKYRGGQWSGMFFDEVTDIPQNEVISVMAWNRSTRPDQLCQSFMFFNPPSNPNGEWVVDYFAPWLEPDYPNPADDGEIRWMTTINNKSREVDSPDPFWEDSQMYIPRPRTFFHSKLDENPDLRDTYPATLSNLPEPMRSMLMKGDFMIGRSSEAWQAIPTSWVTLAMERQDPKPNMTLSALGVDVARGGIDQTVVAKRYGTWYDELVRRPGRDTADGFEVVKMVAENLEGNARINIDLINVGTSPYDTMVKDGYNVEGVNVAEASEGKDRSGLLEFYNKRAEIWWRFREALEPGRGENISLPDDPDLKSDLCAPRFFVGTRGIQIESKDDIRKRLGRSCDAADAVLLAWYTGSGKLPPHIGMGSVASISGQRSLS